MTVGLQRVARRDVKSPHSTQLTLTLTLNTRVRRLMTMLRPGRGAECCDECVCLSVHSCISREPVYNLLLPVFSHNSRPTHTWFRALDSADTLCQAFERTLKQHLVS